MVTVTESLRQTGQKIRTCIFFYCVKIPLFSETYFQSSSEFIFFRNLGKLVRNTAQSAKMADGIYAQLHISNRPVQKEASLPGFHIHRVCNSHLDHSSVRVILK